MKKFLFPLLLIFFSEKVFSMTIKGFYITKSGDTVYTEFIIPEDFPVVTNFIKIIKDGKRTRLRSTEIKSFTMVGTRSQYTFTTFEQDNRHFFQEIVKGKLSLYNVYQRNIINQTANKIPVMVKNDEILYLSGINKRKVVATLVEDCKEIFDKINDIKWFETIPYLEIAKGYNACMDAVGP
ncbi:MAG TPA: hypothetical protein PL009_13515 [Flavipsychrobacter sp.]|nr:hypothetical protein [Flavipsychrobacter sp.]